MLDKENYTAIQLEQNYKLLVEKWGEWEIINAGSAGLVIRYVDVGNALFSGLMFTYCTLAIISFCIAIAVGKIMFPLLVKYFTNNNAEMVDMATLKSASQIAQMSKSKKKKEEWF